MIDKNVIQTKKQISELNMKKKEVEGIIRNYTMAATGVGVIPLPFADAPILITGQVKMIQDIFNIYDLKHDLKTEVLVTMIIQRIISQGAKFLVKYLLKKFTFIAGAIVGGAMAGAVTYSLGMAVSEIGYQLKESEVENGTLNKSSKEINKLVEKAIKVSFDGLGNISEEFLNKFLKKDKIKVR